MHNMAQSESCHQKQNLKLKLTWQCQQKLHNYFQQNQMQMHCKTFVTCDSGVHSKRAKSENHQRRREMFSSARIQFTSRV